VAKIDDLTYDALVNGPERDRFVKFSGECAKIRSAILEDAAKKIFYERDDDVHSMQTRRNYEKASIYYISTGDIVKISEMIHAASVNPGGEREIEAKGVIIGDLSENAIIQAQGIFISAVTLCTRAAVDGGLPEIVAYNLSDAYIHKALEIRDSKKISELTGCMVYDFTYEVYSYKYRDCSLLVRKCCEYISRHLHEAITMKTLSELTGRSENYISDMFFKDIHERPTAYIRNTKLIYAKHVLETADIPVAAISDLLAFPSASSFITYFREAFGMTPFQYRKCVNGDSPH